MDIVLVLGLLPYLADIHARLRPCAPVSEPELEVDPNNRVVMLCAEGMRAESEGRHADAKALFEQAWEVSTDDLEACVAAHYVARHQDNDHDTLRWNEEALRRADAVGDDRVRGFYPSLYLNMGRSHESLGNLTEARRYYELASACVDELAGNRYGDLVRDAVARAKLRTAARSE